MILHEELSGPQLRSLIRNTSIHWGGNRKLKIYGRLGCASGKRMKRMNRVFFTGSEEALALGFRPCAHCMNTDYKKWRDGFV